MPQAETATNMIVSFVCSGSEHLQTPQSSCALQCDFINFQMAGLISILKHTKYMAGTWLNQLPPAKHYGDAKSTESPHTDRRKTATACQIRVFEKDERQLTQQP